jgi:hypothetical protein
MRDFIAALPRHRIHRICLNGELLPLAPYDVKRCEVYAMQNLIALPDGSPRPAGSANQRE